MDVDEALDFLDRFKTDAPAIAVLRAELERLRGIVKKLTRFKDGPPASDEDKAWFTDGNGKLVSCELDATSHPFHENIASIKERRNHVSFTRRDGILYAGDVYPCYSTRSAAEAARNEGG